MTKNTNDTQTTPNNMTVELNDTRLRYLQSKFAKLVKRAKRLQVDAPTLTIDSRRTRWAVANRGHREWFDSEDAANNYHRNHPWSSRPHGYLFTTVTVSGEAPKLPGGWALVARLQHIRTQQGEANIVHTVPDMTCPDTFRDRHVCDHCGTKRRRTDTFVVVNDAGEYKQVGRQCVADFLGHVNPTALACAAEFWGAVTDAAESDDEDRMRRETSDAYTPSYDFLTYLSLAVAMIRVDGFAPARSDKPTTSDISDWYVIDAGHGLFTKYPTAEDKAWHREHAPTDDDLTRAKAILSWGSNLSDDTCRGSDYLYNVRTACQYGFVDHKTAGLVASIPVAYDRALERETARKQQQAKWQDKAAKSNHVGTVGQRLRDIPVTILRKRYMEGYYGTTTIVAMEDDDGNAYTWFASGENDLDVGSRYLMTGTVKKHDTFRDMAQTVVNRCKMVPASA